MRTATDVNTQVDTPQLCSVNCVAVNQRRTGKAVVGIVVGVRRIPLHEDLIRPVAIDITHRGIIGRISIRLSVGRRTIGRFL